MQLAALTGAEPHFEDVRQRERILCRRECEWLGPVRSALKGWVFRRGFVEAVTITAANFLEYAGALLNREPVCRVRFLRAAAHVAALADCPLLARPCALAFSYGYLNDAAVKAPGRLAAPCRAEGTDPRPQLYPQRRRRRSGSGTAACATWHSWICAATTSARRPRQPSANASARRFVSEAPVCRAEKPAFILLASSTARR